MNRVRRSLFTAISLSWLAAAAGAQEPAAAAPHVSVDAARDALAKGEAILIDIREPDEHAQGIAPEAQRLPLSQIQSRLGEIPKDSNKPVLLICRTQNRSGSLAKMLRAQGYAHVSYVDGGMKEWQQRGFATVAPR